MAGLNLATKAAVDVLARAAGALLPVRSILASNVSAAVPTQATDESGRPLPGGLHYPGARTMHTLDLEAAGWSGDCQLEGSQDNVNWRPLVPAATASGTAPATASLTATGVYIYYGAFNALRLNVTTQTSGAISLATIESTQQQ